MSQGGFRWLLAAAILALTFTASAAAGGQEARGIDPNQGDSLVEITLPDKAAAIRLQLEAESYGVDVNEHYLRKNANGTVTVTVFGTEDELDAREDESGELFSGRNTTSVRNVGDVELDVAVIEPFTDLGLKHAVYQTQVDDHAGDAVDLARDDDVARVAMAVKALPRARAKYLGVALVRPIGAAVAMRGGE